MFGYSHLPFSTSDTIYFNGEVFGFILHVKTKDNFSSNINTLVSFTLSIQQDNVIIL
jgi:hypothetical protein